MITVIITSYNEPKATKRAVETFLKQTTSKDLKVVVVDPFSEVEDFLTNQIKDKRFEFILDPGEGKAYALNMMLEMLYTKDKEDILVFTDGDVYPSSNSIQETIKAFEDKSIGCVTAKPVSVDPRNEKYGYWSHFVFSGVDRARKTLSNKKSFFECSGYYFAIRNSVIKEFPVDTSEDSIIPYLFWQKNYKIKYLDNVEVYVKNPSNWKDWLNQRIRNIKAHENLDKIAPDMPRTKSLFNEIKYGWFYLFTHPKNPKEFFWAIQLYFARLYIYLRAFKELKSKDNYQDGWRETEIHSTKPLD